MAEIDAERGQLRLAPAGEQDDFAADRRARGVQKGRAVRRVARGRRGDHGDVVDLHRLAQRAKAAQRLQRLVDAILGESTGGDDALAEPAHRLLVEDRRQRARQPLVGDEAHRIGADVDDGDGLAMVAERYAGQIANGRGLSHFPGA